MLALTPSPTTHSLPPAAVVWVDVVLHLRLHGLVAATQALPANLALPIARDATGEAPPLTLARDALARLASFGHPTTPALQHAAECMAALGPVGWSCPMLPWSPASGPPPAWASPAGLQLRRVDTPTPDLEPEALALLASFGAFATCVPHRVILAGQAAVPDATNPTLRLLWLSHERINVGGVSIDPSTSIAAASPTIGIDQQLADLGPHADPVVVIVMDIDDQSPEDLAIGLDHVRVVPGVLSATLALISGKKGRQVFRVEVLAQQGHAAAVMRACLAQTSSIGLRWHLVQRVTLLREMHEVRASDGTAGGVKTVLRPGGQSTSKVEADVLAASGLDFAGRARLRAELESGGAQ